MGDVPRLEASQSYRFHDVPCIAIPWARHGGSLSPFWSWSFHEPGLSVSHSQRSLEVGWTSAVTAQMWRVSAVRESRVLSTWKKIWWIIGNHHHHHHHHHKIQHHLKQQHQNKTRSTSIAIIKIVFITTINQWQVTSCPSQWESKIVVEKLLMVFWVGNKDKTEAQLT